MNFEHINQKLKNWPNLFKRFIQNQCNDPDIINGDLLFKEDLKNIYVFYGYLPPGKN